MTKEEAAKKTAELIDRSAASVELLGSIITDATTLFGPVTGMKFVDHHLNAFNRLKKLLEELMEQMKKDGMEALL